MACVVCSVFSAPGVGTPADPCRWYVMTERLATPSPCDDPRARLRGEQGGHKEAYQKGLLHSIMHIRRDDRLVRLDYHDKIC